MVFSTFTLPLSLELTAKEQERCSKCQPFCQNLAWSRISLKSMEKSITLSNSSKSLLDWQYRDSWLLRTIVVLSLTSTLLAQPSEQKCLIPPDMQLNSGWSSLNWLLLMCMMSWNALSPTLSSASNSFLKTADKTLNFSINASQDTWSIWKSWSKGHSPELPIPKPLTFFSR